MSKVKVCFAQSCHTVLKPPKRKFCSDRCSRSYHNKKFYAEQQGAVYFRQEDETLVSDNAIDTIRDMNVSLTYTNKPFIEGFFKEVYPLYTQKYSHLKKLATHNILEVKIQKTKVGEGYHTWHCENAEMKARNRILAFMVY